MESAYHKAEGDKRTQKIRAMLRGLPSSCSDFIRSISTTTSTLTRLAYAIDLDVFFTYAHQEIPRFGETDIRDYSEALISTLKARDIEGYSEYLTLYYKSEADESPAPRPLINHEYGIMRKLSTLRSYFDYLFRMERIPGNVASLVPLPKLHEKPILRLEKSETERLLEAVWSGESLSDHQKNYHRITRLRDYAMLMLFLGTGIRVSECVGLDTGDVDLDACALLVTRKGGNQVILYFPREVSSAIAEYLACREPPADPDDNALFLSMQKKRMTQRAVQLMVKKYASIVVPLKKRMSPHKLRSTYATNLYNETGDIYLVADALGHSNVNTTRKHYAAMSDARRREAASHVKLPDKNDTEG